MTFDAARARRATIHHLISCTSLSSSYALDYWLRNDETYDTLMRLLDSRYKLKETLLLKPIFSQALLEIRYRTLTNRAKTHILGILHE